MIRNSILPIISGLILSACSGSTSSNSYYELPAGTTEAYRFECQVAPADFIEDVLGTYTDPEIRDILKKIGGPDQVDPNTFFDALLTESQASGYKLGKNFSKANAGLFEEGSSDEDIVETLRSEYTKVLSTNLERFHNELTNMQLAHNIYLSSSNQLVLEIIPANDYGAINAILQAKKGNFIDFRPVTTAETWSQNISYLFEVTEETVHTTAVDLVSTDLLTPQEVDKDTVKKGPYGSEFWSRFAISYTYDYEGNTTYSTSGDVGYSSLKDTSYVNNFMRTYKDSMPQWRDFAWGSPVTNEQGNATDLVYFYFLEPVNPKIAIHSADILSAEAKESEHMPGWIISITFAATGVQKWGELTSDCIGKPIAIILDNNVVSAPIVQEAIYGGTCEITGNFTEEEANDLAMRINYSSTAYPMVVVKQGLVNLAQ